MLLGVLVAGLLGGCMSTPATVPSRAPAVLLPLDAPAELIQPLGASATIDNVVVTVVDGYANANRVALRYSVAGLRDAAAFPPDVRLSTADGTQLFGRSSSSDPTTSVLVSSALFDAPLRTGGEALDLQLTVTPVADSQGEVASPAVTVPLRVPLRGGRTIGVQQTQSAAGVDVILESVVVAPSETRAWVCFRDPADPTAVWSPNGALLAPGGQRFPNTYTRLPFDQTQPCIELFFAQASGTPGGTWTLTIDTLTASSGDATLPGPWTFEFMVAE